VAWLADPVSYLAHLYASQYRIHGLARHDIATLLGGGVVLGWLGAWLSTTRHLDRLEP
jgi:cell division transport system permease protein